MSKSSGAPSGSSSNANVRPFTKHGRFRTGEIIEHEKHGRGKIEHVIRGSLLVRFRGGLKPLDQF